MDAGNLCFDFAGHLKNISDSFRHAGLLVFIWLVLPYYLKCKFALCSCSLWNKTHLFWLVLLPAGKRHFAAETMLLWDPLPNIPIHFFLPQFPPRAPKPYFIIYCCLCSLEDKWMPMWFMNSGFRVVSFWWFNFGVNKHQKEIQRRFPVGKFKSRNGRNQMGHSVFTYTEELWSVNSRSCIFRNTQWSFMLWMPM